MLTDNRKYELNPPLVFVRDELELALTKKGKWKFLNDLKETEELIQVETFSFGNCYGVIRYEETEESCIKIKGVTWYVVTDINTSMPILKSREAQNYEQQTWDLKPIDYKYSIF